MNEHYYLDLIMRKWIMEASLKKEKAMAIRVDTFIEENNKRGMFFAYAAGGPIFPARASLKHIPTLTIDEAVDLCGFNEEDICHGSGIILPKGNDLSAERKKIAQESYHNSYNLTIIDECSCPAEKKQNHHPDYDKPNEVMKLCIKCHRKADSEMYQRDKQAVILMIALKMILSSRQAELSGDDSRIRRTAVAPNQAARQAEKRCAEPFKAFRPSPSETTVGTGPVKPEGDDRKIQNGGKG